MALESLLPLPQEILDSIELAVPDGPERRMIVFVQNMFNFIVYINWLLVLYDQSKPPCLLRCSLTQLQRALAGGSSLRQIFRARTSSGYVSPPLSADSQSTGCTGEEVLLWFCTVPGPTRLTEVSFWVLRRGISDPSCRRSYKYPKSFTLENSLLFLIV